MKTKPYVAFNIVIMCLLLISPIAIGISFSDWIESLPSVWMWCAIIGMITAFVLISFAIIKSKHFLKVLQIAKDIDEQNLIEYNARNRQEADKYTIDRKEYSNQKKIYSQLNRAKGMIFIIPSMLLSIMFLAFGGFSFLTVLICGFTIGLIYNYFGRIIIISPEGIRSASLFKNQYMKWDRVKTIGISVSTVEGKNNIDAFMLVYVSMRTIKSHQLLIGGDKEGMITFKFRAKMIHHIMAFCNDDIVNLHNVKRWRRYLRKCSE